MTDTSAAAHRISPLDADAPFADRHIGPDPDAVRRMLAVVGHASLDDLALAAVPEAIRWTAQLDLPPAGSEAEVAAELRALAARNTVARSMIGLGYHDTLTPAVIRRNVLENPAWYTAYTPYQPEISQGRLEALLELPDHGRRPHGAADRGGEPARRADRCGRGHDAGPARRQVRLAPSSSSTPTPTRRPSPCWPRAPSRSASSSTVVDVADGLPDGDVFGAAAQLPRQLRRDPVDSSR